MKKGKVKEEQTKELLESLMKQWQRLWENHGAGEGKGGVLSIHGNLKKEFSEFNTY